LGGWQTQLSHWLHSDGLVGSVGGWRRRWEWLWKRERSLTTGSIVRSHHCWLLGRRSRLRISISCWSSCAGWKSRCWGREVPVTGNGLRIDRDDSRRRPHQTHQRSYLPCCKLPLRYSEPLSHLLQGLLLFLTQTYRCVLQWRVRAWALVTS
jgi:hypothetical protein